VVEFAQVVAPAAAAYLGFIESAAAAGVAGGRVYDAIIANVVAASGADVLLTFNVRDFLGLPGGVEIRAPGTPLAPNPGLR
jgi:hypothetical protein